MKTKIGPAGRRIEIAGHETARNVIDLECKCEKSQSSEK